MLNELKGMLLRLAIGGIAGAVIGIILAPKQKITIRKVVVGDGESGSLDMESTDSVEYENEIGNKGKWCVVGAMVGMTIAAITAQQIEARTRRELDSQARQLRRQAEQLAAGLRERADPIIEEADEILAEARERVGELVTEAQHRADPVVRQARSRVR